MIPYSAIAYTILISTRIFHIFIRVENEPLKQQLKQKRRIILKSLLKIFSFTKLQEIFFYKSILFSFQS